MKDDICKNVLVIGIPASLGSLLMSVSQILLNGRMIQYGGLAVAGMGVASKVTMITTSFLFGVYYVLTNTLQAMGAATPSLIINLSRQGILFIPTLFFLEARLGLEGLLWAQPVVDVLSLLLAIVLYIPIYRKMIRE